MLGDKIIVKKDHETVAKGLADILEEDIKRTTDKYVVTVAGESGSGKTGIAKEIASNLNARGIKTIFMQQDDYFIHPPKTNQKLRRENISKVGLSEVNLALLQDHVKKFKDPLTVQIRKPLVVYEEDLIEAESVPCENVKVMVIEGTYVSLLDGVDKKVFLAKTHKNTLVARLLRQREEIDRFTGKILAIEHKIIFQHKKMADMIVEKNYSIVIKRK
ncbi:MAG: hypothetical protein WBD00_04520 [Candidatus Omnitrophota bacterium]